MEAIELINLISAGETSTVQFKLQLDRNDKNGVIDEMVAMSNSVGGIIVFGVDDKTGTVRNMGYDELQETGRDLSNYATDSVKPSIFITTEVVNLSGSNVLIAHIPEGTAKPYKNNNGTIYIKQAGDKRKVTDNSEILRLFQSNGTVFPDEMIVNGTSFVDVDVEKVFEYVRRIQPDFAAEQMNDTILQNINVLNGGRLTLGGLLFFGKEPQRFRPSFLTKAVCFVGNNIGGSDYRDSEDIVGTIPEMYQRAISFFKRNLKHVQDGQNFNSVGKLEIAEVAIEELLQNAYTHRDYTKNAPVRLLIFDNRVEIISPGKLPNSLTIDNIKMGNTVARNSLIVTYGSRLMKYRGLGSGIIRSLEAQPNIELINDKEGEQFIVRIPRGETA